MKSRSKRIAAAIPCYNAQETIADCIRSLIAQTRRPDQIVVGDDGSNDASASIAKALGAKVISSRSNRGVAATRNLIWQNTSADIIVFVDADTQARADLIERLIAGYTADDVAGVGGQGIDVGTESIFDRWRKFTAAQTHGESPIQNAKMLFGLCCSYRRTALERVSGFDPAFRSNGEDHEIGIRLRREGYRLVYDPGAIVYHTRTDSFLSLMKMLYRYELFTQLPKLKNAVPIESHYETFWLRLRFLLNRLGQIATTGHGLKFALIDLAALAPILAACLKAHRLSKLASSSR